MHTVFADEQFTPIELLDGVAEERLRLAMTLRFGAWWVSAVTGHLLPAPWRSQRLHPCVVLEVVQDLGINKLSDLLVDVVHQLHDLLIHHFGDE